MGGAECGAEALFVRRALGVTLREARVAGRVYPLRAPGRRFARVCAELTVYAMNIVRMRRRGAVRRHKPRAGGGCTAHPKRLRVAWSGRVQACGAAACMVQRLACTPSGLLVTIICDTWDALNAWAYTPLRWYPSQEACSLAPLASDRERDLVSTFEKTPAYFIAAVSSFSGVHLVL